MIDLPAKARVACLDGPAGQSTYIIVNPINQQITYLVVKCDWSPFDEVLVPMEEVDTTDPDQITLKCTREELSSMPLFTEEVFIHMDPPDGGDESGDYLSLPFVTAMPGFYMDDSGDYVAVERENVPQGEFAVQRGARVEATDGFVGLVDELLVNSSNMQITHLVLKERHMLGQREITIPVSQIDRVEEDTVYLKLDRKGVEELPTTPTQRWSR